MVDLKRKLIYGTHLTCMSGTAYLGPMQSIFEIVQQVFTSNIKLHGNELDSIGNKTRRRTCIISPLHTFRGTGHVVTVPEQARLRATQERGHEK
jgi:hypothetical protein